MIECRWSPLIEPESGVAFVVSPRSGRLLGFPPTVDLDHASLSPMRRHERLADSMRADVLFTDDWEQGYLGVPHAPRSWLMGSTLRVAWLLARALARWAPLDRSFQLLDRLAHTVPNRDLSIEQILDSATFAERSFHHAPRTQQCLPRTLLRFFLFRLGRFPVEANIGVWLPTEMMHAWVSLGGIPLGEEREEVMHYQACLRFAAAAAS